MKAKHLIYNIALSLMTINLLSCIVKNSNNVAMTQNVTVVVEKGATLNMNNVAKTQNTTINTQNTTIIESNNPPAVSSNNLQTNNAPAVLVSNNSKSTNLNCDKYNDDIIDYVNKGNIKGVKCALQKGANIETKDDALNTLLMMAVIADKKDIVKLLIESGVDIEAKNVDGTSALSWAVFFDNIDMVKLLIENGAIPHIGNTLCNVTENQEIKDLVCK